MTVSKNFVVKRGLEVGGDTLFANSVTDRVGVGTTNPTSTLTVKGNTALEDLTVSGVSTFSSRVAIGTSNPVSSLTVAGSGTSTSQLFVTGLSTFHNNAFIASDNRLYFGAETLSISFQSTPSVSNYIETFDHVPLNIVTEDLTVGASDGEKFANFRINSSVSLYYDNSKKFETSGLGVTVTGVTSTTYLYATGISTFIDGPVFIGSAVTTGTALQRLQVTGGGYFSSPVGIGITNPSNTLTVVGSGTSTAQLYVVGFSTFVGYSTFRDYVNIEDGVFVAGVSTFVGYSTFRDYVNIEDGLNVSGVSTFVGYSTFRDYVNVEDGLNVLGISTFVGYSTFRDYVNIEDGLNVAGISTFVGYSTFRDYVNIEDGLNVSGVSTFVGYSTFRDYVNIEDGLNVSGISTFVGFSTFQDYVNIQDGLNVSGVSTFTNNVNISGNTLITGVTTSSSGFSGNLTGNVTGNLNSSGVNTATTISGTSLTYNTGNLTTGNIVTGIVTTLSGTNLNYSGVTTTGILNVGTGGTVITTTSEGNVGLGTNPTSKLHVIGDALISGISTANSFRARGGAPGALGVNNNGYGFFGSGDNDSGMYSSADGQVEFYSNSVEIFRYNTTSVGIGTTIPVSKLSVVGGDASVGINTSQGVILTSANGTRYRLFVENDGTLKTVAV